MINIRKIKNWILKKLFSDRIIVLKAQRYIPNSQLCMASYPEMLIRENCKKISYEIIDEVMRKGYIEFTDCDDLGSMSRIITARIIILK